MCWQLRSCKPSVTPFTCSPALWDLSCRRSCELREVGWGQWEANLKYIPRFYKNWKTWYTGWERGLQQNILENEIIPIPTRKFLLTSDKWTLLLNLLFSLSSSNVTSVCTVLSEIGLQTQRHRYSKVSKHYYNTDRSVVKLSNLLPQDSVDAKGDKINSWK